MMMRSEEHTSELQSLRHLVCRLLLEKKETAAKGRGSRLRGSARSLSESGTGGAGSGGAYRMSGRKKRPSEMFLCGTMIFFSTIRGPRGSTLFPYPLLFR